MNTPNAPRVNGAKIRDNFAKGASLRQKGPWQGPSRLVAERNIQFAESAKLEKAIKVNLKGLGYGK
jgi:hypothetical protein